MRSGGRLPAVGRNGVPYCLSNEGFHRDVGVSAEFRALRRGIAAYRSKADVLIVAGRLTVLTIPQATFLRHEITQQSQADAGALRQRAAPVHFRFLRVKHVAA